MSGLSPISGFSIESLIHEVEINFWEAWANFGDGPGCTLHDEEDVLWFETPIPIIPYNMILRSHMKKDVNQRIEDIISYFKRRKVVILWVLHPSSLPLDLPVLLQEYGLQQIEILPCMVRNLEDIPDISSLPIDVEIREVIEESDMDEFQEITTWRWGVPPEYHRQLQAMIRNFNIGKAGSKTHMWLALRNGIPISKVASYYGERSVGIYGVATKTEARGQGLASFLVIEAMKAARKAGKKLADA